MLKGFREFVMRGNVVELAVAVVVAGAFGAIITAFTDGVIQPIVAVFGGTNVTGLAFELVPGNEATLLDLNLVVAAVVQFLITAAVVYFVFVLPMNRIAERRAAGQEPEPEEKSEDVLLLTEIRDLLRAQQRQ